MNECYDAWQKAKTGTFCAIMGFGHDNERVQRAQEEEATAFVAYKASCQERNDLDRAIIDYLAEQPAGVCTNWLAHGVGGHIGPAAFARVLESLVGRGLIRDAQHARWKAVG